MYVRHRYTTVCIYVYVCVIVYPLGDDILLYKTLATSYLDKKYYDNVRMTVCIIELL